MYLYDGSTGFFVYGPFKCLMHVACFGSSINEYNFNVGRFSCCTIIMIRNGRHGRAMNVKLNLTKKQNFIRK